MAVTVTRSYSSFWTRSYANVTTDADSNALSLSAAGVQTYYQIYVTLDANRVLSSTPTLHAGFDGQEMIITVVSAGFTLTLQDKKTLSGSLLALSGQSIALGPSESLHFIYSASLGAWVQVGTVHRATFATNTGSTSATLTAYESLATTLSFTGSPTTGITFTTATAANIINFLGIVPLNNTYFRRMRVRNATGQTITLAQGANVTLTNGAISAGMWRDFDVSVASSTTVTYTAAGGGRNANSDTTVVGAVAAPASGTTSLVIDRNHGPFCTLTFALTAARITVTDGGASGSYGSLKLFDFVQTGVLFLGCRADYTAFVEGAALTTAAGDAAFVIGLGTTAIAAAFDASLPSPGATDISAPLALTNTAGTTTGTKFTNSNTAVDGTTTATDIYLNWSGSAATIDANSTIDVTGTFTIACVLLGDD